MPPNGSHGMDLGESWLAASDVVCRRGGTVGESGGPWTIWHTRISRPRRYVKGRSAPSEDVMRRIGDAFTPAPEPTSETRTETGTETVGSRVARARRRRRIQ